MMNAIATTDEVRWSGARRGMVALRGIGASTAREGMQRRMAVVARQSGCERTPQADCAVDATALDERLRGSSGCDRTKVGKAAIERKWGSVIGVLARP